jgi:hypothetical protein
MTEDFKDIEAYFTARRELENATDRLAASKVEPNEAWLNIELPKFSNEFISTILRRNGGNGRSYTASVIYEDRGTAKVIHVELRPDDPNNHVDAVIEAIANAFSKKREADAKFKKAIGEGLMTLNEARSADGKGAL